MADFVHHCRILPKYHTKSNTICYKQYTVYNKPCLKWWLVGYDYRTDIGIDIGLLLHGVG
jgi:hypothetical protein